MSEHDDPLRLAVGGSPDVRELLRSARGDEPSPQALARLEARLAPTLAARPPATLVGARRWLVVAAGAIGVAAVIWWARDAASPRAIPNQPRSPTSIPAAPPPASIGPRRPEPSPVVAPSTGSPAAPAAPRPRRPPAAPAIVVPPPIDSPILEAPRAEPARVEPAQTAPPPTPEPRPREIDLLGPAHDALRAKDTQRALELATEHADLYPRGAMTEEREAIIVEGWLQLGRHDAAQASFDRFVERFPRSGYRARLQRLIANGP
jgi:hypothetical protein